MDNTKKVVGAYVWYRRRLMRITGVNIKNDFILNRQVSIKRASAKLAKIGDHVKYVDLNVLPQYCKEQKDIVITIFRDNDLVCTNVDRCDFDDTNHLHFKKA